MQEVATCLCSALLPSPFLSTPFVSPSVTIHTLTLKASSKDSSVWHVVNKTLCTRFKVRAHVHKL